MSAARLILKQPTGWFAAGREVAQALALLPDGAFKLYIHLCLEAERHTGRALIDLAALTPDLTQGCGVDRSQSRRAALHRYANGAAIGSKSAIGSGRTKSNPAEEWPIRKRTS